MIRYSFILFWSALLLCCFAALPCAVHAGEITLGLGGSIGNSPYKRYDSDRSALPFFSYDSESVYLRGRSAGFKFLNLDFLEVSAFVKYDDTSFDPSDSDDPHLRRLGERHESALGGMEARLTTPVGMLIANGAGDLLGNSKGFTGEFGYRYSLELGPVEFIPAAGLYWSSERYNKYYYGITSSQSRKSGLQDYEAGAGASPYVGLTVDYSLSDNWDLFLSGEVKYLGSAIADSPMVDKTHTQSVTGGVTYSF